MSDEREDRVGGKPWSQEDILALSKVPVGPLEVLPLAALAVSMLCRRCGDSNARRFKRPAQTFVGLCASAAERAEAPNFRELTILLLTLLASPTPSSTASIAHAVGQSRLSRVS